MPSSRNRIYAAISMLLLAALFAANLYRAKTQSITIDEAFTYNHFVATSADSPVRRDSPYNENLNTQLCRLFVGLFGVSEFTMRVPSVLGGLLYFFALFRLCRYFFGDSFWLLLAVALNSLNPFLLDSLSAARGYSLGLAFWTLGAYYVARCVAEGSTPALVLKAAVALGLAIGSHVSEVFGVAALEIAFASIVVADRWTEAGAAAAFRSFSRIAAPLVMVTIVVASATLWTVLPRFAHGNIDNVVRHFPDGLRSLVNASVLYKPTWLTAREAGDGPLHRWGWILLPLLMAGTAFAVVPVARRWRNASILDRLLALLAASLLFAGLFLRIEPHLFHHGYWFFRRLMFALPLIFTAFPLWLRWLSDQGRLGRGAAYAGAAALGIVSLNFALEFNTKYYLGWEFDAGTRQVVNLIREQHAVQPGAKDRVGVTWLLNESFNFYRAMYGLDWIAEASRDSPACLYDYYYVVDGDYPQLKGFAPVELYRNPTAGTILAQPGEAFKQRLTDLRQIGYSDVLPCEADILDNTASVDMSDSSAKRHLLRDFLCAEHASWCWTAARPAILFHVPKGTKTQFKMDFVIHGPTFAGPVRMTVWLNGAPIGEKTYDSPEHKIFEQAVPQGRLRSDGIALIETTLDRYYVAPEDKQKLGYLLVSAGFVP